MFPNELRTIYNIRYRAPFSGTSYNSAVEKDIFVITKLLTVTAPRNICDLCCGLGMHIIKLAEIPGYCVVGVDYSSVAFERYHAAYGHSLNPTYICKSVGDYAVANSEYFDAVLCYLPHIDSVFDEETKHILSASYRLCKKGGIVIMSFLCADYASQMTGKTTVCYDQQSSISISSLVTFCSSNNHLCIKQTSEAWEGVICEEMYLYTIAEIMQRLYETGFKSVVSLDTKNDFKDIAAFQRDKECKATLICQK